MNWIESKRWGVLWIVGFVFSEYCVSKLCVRSRKKSFCGMCSFIIWHRISETSELFPCEMRQDVLPKFCYISTKPHDITSQKTLSLETETLFNES